MDDIDGVEEGIEGVEGLDVSLACESLACLFCSAEDTDDVGVYGIELCNGLVVELGSEACTYDTGSYSFLFHSVPFLLQTA